MENVSEYTNNFLEFLVLEDVDQPLRALTSISIGIPIKGSCELLWEFVLEENDVFAEILLSATIWDGSKKERSNGHIHTSLLSKKSNKRKRKEKFNQEK